VRVLLDCVRPDRDCGQLRNVGSTVTIDPYSPLAGRKAELLRWLTEEGRFAPDTGRLLELLCNKLAALGISDSPRHGARSHAPSRIPWSGAHLAAWREHRDPHHAPRYRVSRRITRIAPFSTSSKPGSGSTPCLAKPPTGAFRSLQRCGRKASRIT